MYKTETTRTSFRFKGRGEYVEMENRNFKGGTTPFQLQRGECVEMENRNFKRGTTLQST